MDEFDSVLGNRASWSDRVWPWAKWGALFLIIWSQISMCSHLGRISEKSGQTFVQTSTGHGLPVKGYSPLHREPQTIHQFLLSWGAYTVKLIAGVTPDDGLQIRTCSRVSSRRVISNTDTFPTTPLRTMHDSFPNHMALQ